MSFRVWFLRMVWIVAAAVALSGCNGDEKENENENGTGPEGDGPSLAVAVTPADVTIGADGASGDHDVKVTITSDDDAHKTAEVELSVACTESVKAPAIGIAKKDAAAGMAEWEGQSVGLDKATVCTYTAKALEKEATGTFTVKAAGATGDVIAVTSVEFYSDASLTNKISAAVAEDADVWVVVNTDKDVDDASNINLSWKCMNGSADITDANGDVTGLAVVGAGDKKQHSVELDNTPMVAALDASHAGATCTFTAKVGDNGTAGTEDLMVNGADSV